MKRESLKAKKIRDKVEKEHKKVVVMLPANRKKKKKKQINRDEKFELPSGNNQILIGGLNFI